MLLQTNVQLYGILVYIGRFKEVNFYRNKNSSWEDMEILWGK